MVFVTGSSGLIGSHLIARLLEQGYAVKALVRHPPAASPDQHPQLTYITGDILDTTVLQTAIEAGDYVFHCAGLVSYAPQDAAWLKQINVEGTANVVNACLLQPRVKLCHVSSIAAIGPQKGKNTVDESAKWDANAAHSAYASSKYFGELEVWRGVAEGLAAVIVNPSVVLGPADWNRSSTQLFKYVARQKPFYTGGLLNFVDVRDVITAMMALAFSDIRGERFILNAGQVTYQVFFEKVAFYLRRRAPTLRVPAAVAEVMWRFERLRSFFTGQRPLITRETARLAKRNYFYANDKVKNGLPLAFKPLDETVQWCCQELRQKYRLPV